MRDGGIFIAPHVAYYPFCSFLRVALQVGHQRMSAFARASTCDRSMRGRERANRPRGGT